jgi:HprK-related kinase A
MYNGWRLLSDEFGLVRLHSTEFIPIPRCIPLKNESIEVIRKFCPNAILGPTFPKTRKGDVAHAKPTTACMQQVEIPAQAAFIIFPQYTKGISCQLNTIAKPRAFMKLSHNSFNYELLGKSGFETVAAIVEQCDCRLFEYDDLNSAMCLFDELVS